MQRHCRSVYLSPHHRQRRICMVTDVLFHPDHMIPPPELIAALVEFAHHPVAQLFMEPDAVPCQIGVRSPMMEYSWGELSLLGGASILNTAVSSSP